MYYTGDNIIKIVMTADKNFILPMKVTLWSALCNADEKYFYDVNVLCSKNELEQIHREALMSIECVFENVKIHFTEVKDELFKNAAMSMHCSVASYYRLLIAEIIEGDKCLFLDGDLIIKTDIAKIYQMDLREKLLAGVLDCGIQNDLTYFDEHRKIIGIPSLEQYINVGVLLLNLKKIRQMKLSKLFMEHMRKGYLFMDNDILNKCCYENILLLESKYNIFSKYFMKPQIIHEKNPQKSELLKVTKNDVIIHFVGGLKPWNNMRVAGANEWWYFAQKALSQREYIELEENARKNTVKIDVSTLIKAAKAAEDIIIFGYSDIGKQVCDILEKNKVMSIRSFCDNAENKQGQDYKGYKVDNVKNLMENYPNAFWIITSQNYYNQIKIQLENHGVLSEQIMRYMHKGIGYYELLDDQYLEHEQEEQKYL